jgi:hypothetical protein
MPLESYIGVFLVGTAGGILLEFLHWWNIRKRNEFPKYARSVRYWVITAGMALVGGLLALFYFGDRAQAILVLAPCWTFNSADFAKTSDDVCRAGGARGRGDVRDFILHVVGRGACRSRRRWNRRLRACGVPE